MTAGLDGAVISDFDGTLALLAVPWPDLRASLSITRIDDLWHDPDAERWEVVTQAEIDAARVAAPVPGIMEALASATTVAVLTSNDEAAVEIFLARWPELAAKIGAIVGRRALAGPKTEFAVFASGYERCLRSVTERDAGVTYIGDMRYELDFARRLGARAVDVKELEAASRDA